MALFQYVQQPFFGIILAQTFKTTFFDKLKAPLKPPNFDGEEVCQIQAVQSATVHPLLQ